MITQFDIIAHDMFALDPNDFARLIQPYRDVSVAEQLINTRQNWSETFTTISTDSEELQQILTTITERVGKTNARFAARPEKQIEPYSMRTFRLAEFLTFLQAGKTAYADVLESLADHEPGTIPKPKDDGVTIDKQYEYVVYSGYSSDSKQLLKWIPTALMHHAAKSTNIPNVFEQPSPKVAESAIVKNQPLYPIFVDFVGEALMEIVNGGNLQAAYNLDVPEVPVVFRDRYGKVVSAKIESSGKFNMNIKVDHRKLIDNSTTEEFAEYAYHQHDSDAFKKLKWIKSGYSYEKGEFERTAKSMKIDVAALEKNYNTSKMVKLQNDVWRNLENTRSWDTQTIEDVDSTAKRYATNYKKIFVEMVTIEKLYCPIILQKSGKYSLIAGNTRLMICRAMNVVPEVVIVAI